MKFEIMRASNIADPIAPHPRAAFNDHQLRWEIDVTSLDELVAIGEEMNSPLTVLAVSKSALQEGDLPIIEIRNL